MLKASPYRSILSTLSRPRLTQWICAFLVPIFILEPLAPIGYAIFPPSIASATTSEAPPEDTELEPLAENIEVNREPDGTKTATVNTRRVFYKDSNNKFQRINNRLTERTPGTFENTANDLSVRFTADPATDTTKDVSVGKNGLAVKMGVPEKGAAPQKGRDQLAYFGSEATYHYSVQSDGIKESIILTRPPASGTFVFPLKLTGLTAVPQADRSILLKNSITGKDEFTIRAPYMYDSSTDPITGEQGRYSDEVRYQINETGGVTTLSVIADEGFLNDPATVYPVVIDPTIEELPSLSRDMYWSDAGTNNPYGGYNEIKEGNTYTSPNTYRYRAYVGFDMANIITNLNETINSASLSMYANYGPYASNVELREVNVDGWQWDETSDSLAWNDQWTGGRDLWYYTSNGYVDTKTVSTGWVTFDATTFVRDWAFEGEQNGFVLKGPDEGYAGNWYHHKFYSREWTTPSQRPYLKVNYGTPEFIGTESFWTFEDEDFGSGHSASVNVANGNLVVQKTDLSVSDRAFDLELSRTYNSKVSTGDALVPMGRGWRMNLPRLSNAEYAGTPYERVLYTDEDGSVHYFQVTIDGHYESPAGIDQLELSTNDAGGWTLVNPDYTTQTFDAQGRITSSSDRYTTSTGDAQNRISYTYDGSGRLSEVKSPSDGGRKLTLTYVSNKLDKITETGISGRSVKFTYDGNGRLSGASNPSTNGSYTSATYGYVTADGALSSFKVPGETDDAWVITYAGGKVSTWRDPRGGASSSLSYNATGDVATVTGPLGLATDYGIDARAQRLVKHGLVTDVTDEAGAASHFDYDRMLNVTRQWSTDSAGNILSDSSAEYDADGDPTVANQVVSSGTIAKWLLAYNDRNATHDSSSWTSPMGNLVKKNFTAEGALGNSVDPQEVTEVGTYDKYGNVIKSKSYPEIIDSFSLNSSFEKGATSDSATADSWRSYPTTTSGRYTRALAPAGLGLGSWAAKIVGGGPTYHKGVWTQLYGVTSEATTYTISTWVNVPAYTSGTFHPMRASVLYDDAPSSPVTFDGQVIAGATTGWIQQSLTFTTSATRDVDHINFYAFADTGDNFVGTAWVDGLQLEASPLLSGYNLIGNGGFDRDETADSIPDGWIKSTTAGATYTYATSPSDVFTGMKAVKLKNTSTWATTGDSKVYMTPSQQAVPLKPNTDYTLTVSASADALGASDVQIAKLTANNGAVYDILAKGTFGWRTITKSFTTGASVASVSSLELKLPVKSASIGFDGVKLEEVRRESTSTYDAYGRFQTAQTDELGSTTHMTYDARGNLTSTSSNGRTASAVYDSRDLITKDTNALGTSKYYSYDGAGNRTAARGPRSSGPTDNTYKVTYDYLPGTSALSAITDPLGRRTSFSFDAAGRTSRTTLPSGVTIDNAYDNLNQLTSVTYQSSPTPAFSYGYDSSGRQRYIKRAGVSLDAYAYDMASQLRSQTDYNVSTSYPYTISHGYDLDGNVTADGYGGVTTDLRYDEGGKITKLTRGAQTIGLDYDENGLPVRVTRSGAAGTFSAYDQLGRTTSLTHLKSSGAVLEENKYVYDVNGNITSHYATGSGTTAYSYDVGDRLTNWQDPVSGGTYGYSYDAGDNATSVTVDSKNLLTVNEATVEQGTSGFSGYSAAISKSTSESQQGSASLKAVTNNSIAAEGFSTYAIDVEPSTQYTASVYVKGSGTVRLTLYELNSSYTHTFSSSTQPVTLNSGWQRISVPHNFSATGEYARLYIWTTSQQNVTFYADGLQLEESGAATDWALPDSTIKSFTHDAADQITTYEDSSTGATQSYNFAYDTQGNLTSDGSATYAWNAGGRLTSYAKSGVTTTYAYDDRGYRTAKTVAGVKTFFHWNGAQMIAERTSTGDPIATYTYLPGSYSPESMLRGGSTYYYLKNARGDVTAMTDSSGAVVAKYRYDPWGNILGVTDGNSNDVSGNPSHIANLNPWRYAGYYLDKESGMYYLQARYYRADLMRFISVDSLCACRSNTPSSPNFYGYSFANPVMFIDPNGMSALPHIFRMLLVGRIAATRLVQGLGLKLYLRLLKIGTKNPGSKEWIRNLKSKWSCEVLDMFAIDTILLSWQMGSLSGPTKKGDGWWIKTASGGTITWRWRTWNTRAVDFNNFPGFRTKVKFKITCKYAAVWWL